MTQMPDNYTPEAVPAALQQALKGPATAIAVAMVTLAAREIHERELADAVPQTVRDEVVGMVVTAAAVVALRAALGTAAAEADRNALFRLLDIQKAVADPASVFNRIPAASDRRAVMALAHAEEELGIGRNKH